MENNKKKQFTLIELIIVIVVIGILAGMTLPKFMGVQKDAKVAALQGDLDVLDKAIMLYNSNSDDNSYPLTDKIEKDALTKTLVDTLAKIDDDSTEIYNLDETKLSPYVSRLKYDINDYAYSTKTNHVFYKSGKIDSKGNIYYLNESYLKSDGSESNGGNTKPQGDTTKPTVTLTPHTTDLTDKVVITVSASDEGGIKSIELPDGTLVTGKETTTYEVTSNGDYIFKVIDNNNNITEQTININNIDNTNPTLTLTPNTTSETNKVVITISASDESGIKSIELPDGTILNDVETTTYEVITNGDFKFKVTDNNNNVTEKKITIKNILTMFSKVYGGSNWDYLYSIEQTNDGGYIACGYTQGGGDFTTSKGERDALIIKYDSQGNKEWSKVYGGSGEDELKSIKQTSDGGYIACGYTSGGGDFTTSKGNYDTLIVKLDSQGNKLWFKQLGGSSNDYLYSIEQTSDGGYIACGSTKGGGDFTTSKGNYDTLIIKFDSQGNKLWSTQLGGSSYYAFSEDELKSIKQTSDGGYIACGSTLGGGDFDTSKGNTDTLIIKYDSQGNKLWSTQLGGSGYDQLLSIKQTSDGGYIAVGSTQGGGDFDNSKGNYDTLIIKYDSQGNKLWFKQLGGSSNDYLYSIEQTSDGGYIAVGATSGGGDFDVSKGNYDTLIIKYDSQGNKLWSRVYGGSGEDYLLSVEQNSNGQYVAVGATSGGGDFDVSKGSYDTLFIKIK